MKRPSVLKSQRVAPRDAVRRRYAQATAATVAGGWVILAHPDDGTTVRHVLGRGLSEREAWADAAGRGSR